MPLILRFLTWLIAFYRRFLSGRGPLRQVRCSFAPDESCSAYGLRVTAEAPSARTAIVRIARRLQRCREACLLTDGRALSWTPLHDLSPGEIVAQLRGDGERPPAIARVLAARRAVALWRHDQAALAQLDALAREMPELAAAPRVCSFPGVVARARRRFTVLAVLAVAALAVVLAQPWLGGGAELLALVATVTCVRSALALQRRFAVHRTWAQRRLRGVVLPARS